MKKFVIVAALVIVAGVASAYKMTGDADVVELKKELIAAGCVVDSIQKVGNTLYVRGDACASANTVLAAHDKMKMRDQRSTLKARILALKDKAEGRTITDDERDELMVKMLDYIGVK